MARRAPLTADGVAFHEFPSDAVREDRGQDVLDLQLGSVGALDLVQPILNLHGLHVVGNMTVPRWLDPVFYVRLVSLAGGFRQAREFVICIPSCRRR